MSKDNNNYPLIFNKDNTIIESYDGIYTDSEGNILSLDEIKRRQRELYKPFITDTPWNSYYLQNSSSNNVKTEEQLKLDKINNKIKDYLLLYLTDKANKEKDAIDSPFGRNPFTSFSEEKKLYETPKDETESKVSFLRNYYDVVNNGNINLDDKKNETYRNKYSDLPIESLTDMIRYKRRSLLTLWEINEDWNLEGQDNNYLLDTEKGKEFFFNLPEFRKTPKEDIERAYEYYKRKSNARLAQEYPLVFNSLMNEALGTYYSKVNLEYANDPEDFDSNENLGITSANKHRERVMRNTRIAEYEQNFFKDPNNPTAEEVENISKPWNFFKRVLFNISGYAQGLTKGAIESVIGTGMLAGEWLSLTDTNYNNLLRTAAKDMIEKANQYRKDNSPALSEKEKEYNVALFDYLAELNNGNYNDDFKDAYTDDLKSDIIISLHNKARFANNQKLINDELKAELQNKENEEQGFFDFIGSGVNTVVSTIGPLACLVINFAGQIPWQSPLIAYAAGESLINWDSTAFENLLLESLDTTLNNKFAKFASVWELSGSPIFSLLDKFLYGEEYTEEEKEAYRKVGIEVSESDRKNRGATFGLWTRAYGEENSFVDLGTILETIRILSLAGGLKIGSTALGIATNAGSKYILRAALAAAKKLIATKAANITFKTAKETGMLLNSMTPVMTTAALDLGYASSFYDEKMAKAEDYVNSLEFRDLVNLRALLLYETNEEFRNLVIQSILSKGNLIKLEIYKKDSESINNLVNNLTLQRINELLNLQNPDGSNTIINPDAILLLVLLEVLGAKWELYKAKYFGDILFENEKLKYLDLARTQALKSAGMVHVLTMLPDGILTSTWMSAMYKPEMYAYEKRIWQKFKLKIGKPSNNSNISNTELRSRLRREYGIEDIDANGKIIGADSYTASDFRRDLINMIKGGFTSNYLLDVGVGAGGGMYLGIMDLYTAVTLDPNKSVEEIAMLVNALGSFDYAFTKAIGGAFDAADNKRSYLDGAMGGSAHAVVLPTSLYHTFNKSMKGKDYTFKNIAKATSDAVLRSTLGGFAKQGSIIKDINNAISERNKIIENFLNNYEKGNIFKHLSLMNDLNIKHIAAINSGDIDKAGLIDLLNAMEVAAYLSVLRGTTYYNVAMELLKKILELGRYEENGNDDKVKKIIELQKLLNNNEITQELKKELLKQLNNFLLDSNNNNEIKNYLDNLATKDDLSDLLSTWNHAYETSFDLLTMIENSNVNRLEALSLFAEKEDPNIIYAYTLMLNYRDLLYLQIQKQKDIIKNAKEKLNESLEDIEASNPSTSVYNILYTLSSINTELELEEAKLAELKTRLKATTELQKTASEEEKKVHLNRIFNTLYSIMLLELKITKLKRARDKYTSREDSNSLEKPFYNAKDIINLDLEELLFMIDPENFSKFSEDLLKEILKVLTLKSNIDEITRSTYALNNSYVYDSTNKDNYASLLAKMLRLLNEHTKVNNEINSGWYSSDLYLKYYYKNAKDASKAIFKSKYLSTINPSIKGNTEAIFNWYKTNLSKIQQEYEQDTTKKGKDTVDKAELIKNIKLEALTEVLKTLDDTTSKEILKLVLEYNNVLDTIKNFPEGTLSDTELELLKLAFDYLFSINKTPSIKELLKLTESVDNKDLDPLRDFINEHKTTNDGRDYKLNSDLTRALRESIERYKQHITKDKPLDADEVVIHRDNTNDELSDEEIEESREKEKPKKRTDSKKEEEDNKKRQNDKKNTLVKAGLTTNHISPITVYNWLLAGININPLSNNYIGIKEADAASNTLIQELIKILKSVKDLKNPYDALLSKIEELNKANDSTNLIGKALKDTVNGILKEFNAPRKPKELIRTEFNGEVSTPKDNVKLINIEELDDSNPEHLVLKELFSKYNIITWLQLNRMDEKSSITFISLPESKNYLGIAYQILKNDTTADIANTITDGDKTYQIIGFIDKNSHEKLKNVEHTGEIKVLSNLTAQYHLGKFHVTSQNHSEAIMPSTIEEITGTKNVLEALKDAAKNLFSIVENQIRFHKINASKEKDVNSTEYSVVTPVEIGLTLIRISDGLYKSINEALLNNITDIIRNNKRISNLNKSIQNILDRVDKLIESEGDPKSLTAEINKFGYADDKDNPVSLTEYIYGIDGVIFLIKKNTSSGELKSYTLEIAKGTISNGVVNIKSGDNIASIPLTITNNNSIGIRDASDIVRQILYTSSFKDINLNRTLLEIDSLPENSKEIHEQLLLKINDLISKYLITEADKFKKEISNALNTYGNIYPIFIKYTQKSYEELNEYAADLNTITELANKITDYLPIIKWLINQNLFDFTNDNRLKYLALYIADAIEDGILRFTPIEVTGVDMSVSSILDSTNPTKPIEKPVTAVDAILDYHKKEKIDTSKRTVLSIQTIESKWNDFCSKIGKIIKASPYTKTIGLLDINNKTNSGMSGDKETDLTKSLASLALSYVMGDTYDSIFREVINEGKTKELLKYITYSKILSEDHFNLIVELAKALRQYLIDEYSAVKFYNREMRMTYNGKSTTPDIVFMDKYGLIHVLDLKTTLKNLNEFTNALFITKENLDKKDNEWKTNNGYIVNYPRLLAGYALLLEDFSEGVDSSVTVNDVGLVLVRPEYDPNDYDVTCIYTIKDGTSDRKISLKEYNSITGKKPKVINQQYTFTLKDSAKSKPRAFLPIDATNTTKKDILKGFAIKSIDLWGESSKELLQKTLELLDNKGWDRERIRLGLVNNDSQVKLVVTGRSLRRGSINEESPSKSITLEEALSLDEKGSLLNTEPEAVNNENLHPTIEPVTLEGLSKEEIEKIDALTEASGLTRELVIKMLKDEKDEDNPNKTTDAELASIFNGSTDESDETIDLLLNGCMPTTLKK